MTVRLSTAYSTVCQVTSVRAGATATTPNMSHTSSDSRLPVSSTNGISLIAPPAAAAKAIPPVNAAMNPFPPSATDVV